MTPLQTQATEDDILNILALDTSSRAASCAWLENGNLRGEFFMNAEIKHSQTIMPMVSALLQSIGREVTDADLFAVSNGPGSFTGLRIGVSAIKGMAMATGKPCAPVSTLHSLAINMLSVNGYIVPIMDARGGQVYSAVFHAQGRQLTRVCEDMAVHIDDLCKIIKPYAGKPIMLVGDGAAPWWDYFEKKGLTVDVAPGALTHQRASSVCSAALEIVVDGKEIDAAALDTVYLRLPQAERERLNKSAQG